VRNQPVGRVVDQFLLQLDFGMGSRRRPDRLEEQAAGFFEDGGLVRGGDFFRPWPRVYSAAVDFEPVPAADSRRDLAPEPRQDRADSVAFKD
jgi:hypothetical protein